MSGYDDEPDYGGPPPGWRNDWLAIVMMAAVAAIPLWFYWPG